jgi:hypothetical protein
LATTAALKSTPVVSFVVSVEIAMFETDIVTNRLQPHFALNLTVAIKINDFVAIIYHDSVDTEV